MEREHILNFLAENKTELDKIHFLSCEIVLYGRENTNHPFQSFITYDGLFLYNVVLPRIYSKYESLDHMNDGILSLVNEINTPKIIYHDDLLELGILDAFTKKDIDTLDYKVLYLIPVVKNNNHIASIIIFANKYDESFILDKGSITSLINKLSVDAIDQLSNLIKNTLGSIYENNYCLVRGDNMIMFNNPINPVKLDKSPKEINLFINDSNIKKVEFGVISLYYLNLSQFKDETIQTFDISSLNDMKRSDDYSLIVFNYQNEIKDISVFIKNLPFEFSYKVFKDGAFYLIYINKTIYKPTFKKAFENFKDYHLLVHSDELSKEMDLIKLVTYFKLERPIEFNFKEYQKYLTRINSELMFIDEAALESKVINSRTLVEMPLVNRIIEKDFEYENIIRLETITVKALKEAVSKYNTFYISIPSTMIHKKKLTDVISENINKNIYMFIHLDKITNRQDFYNGLIKLKTLNCKILVDSSIFFNIHNLDLSDFIDGIYINKEECNNLLTGRYKIFTSILSFYLSEQKDIILKDTTHLINADIHISYIK